MDNLQHPQTILQEYAEKDIVYLNYAATSFPKSLIALHSFYKNICSLPEGSRQNQSNTHMHILKKRAANILHIQPEHVFFTHSATVGLNQVIKGAARNGCRLAIDNRSHNAVIRSWHSLADRCQCMLASIYDEKDQFIEEKLLEILAKSPDLLCLTHISNVNGSIYPVPEIISLVRSLSPSTSILVDASQSAGAVSLASLNEADFLVFPSHKHLHSVPGAAILVAKKRLEPIISGGTGSHSMATETFEENDLFAEVGTMNVPAIVALIDSLEFAEANLNQHRKAEDDLTSQFIEGIKSIHGLSLIGRKAYEKRVAIIALRTEFGFPEIHWAPFLKTQNIFVRGGLHCSPLHHKQLGLSQSGTLRFSLGWNSTSEHVAKALNALQEFSAIVKKVLL